MKKDLNFVGKSKIFFGISIAIILIGIVCNFIFGTTLDIQFKGGAIITYSFTGEIDEDALKDTIQTATPNNVVTFTVSKDIMNNEENADAYVIDINFSGETAIDTAQQDAITKALEKDFAENNFEYQESTSVEASMGLKFLLK